MTQQLEYAFDNQQPAATTHEIAAGKFGHRVEGHGPGREVVELAADFNRMSGHVQSYVEKREEAGTHPDFAVSDAAFSVAYF